jgi:hypothetical protein
LIYQKLNIELTGSVVPAYPTPPGECERTGRLGSLFFVRREQRSGDPSVKALAVGSTDIATKSKTPTISFGPHRER